MIVVMMFPEAASLETPPKEPLATHQRAAATSIEDCFNDKIGRQQEAKPHTNGTDAFKAPPPPPDGKPQAPASQSHGHGCHNGRDGHSRNNNGNSNNTLRESLLQYCRAALNAMELSRSNIGACISNWGSGSLATLASQLNLAYGENRSAQKLLCEMIEILAGKRDPAESMVKMAA